MAEILTLTRLAEAVRGTAAAFRSRTTLQPAAGEGTKVFPPTYAGAKYAFEKRRLPGRPEPVDCVLLDSVQSQANRMEEALQQAVDAGRFQIPIVEVDFSTFWDPEKKGSLTDDLRLREPVGRISSLQAPHRIADAILRDSIVEEDGKPFRAKDEKDESPHGQRLRRASAQAATALFELDPMALVLGMWDSTGPKGGLGAKIERALVSEVVGIDAVLGVKTSSRIDPLAIQKDAGPLYRRRDGGYTLDPAAAQDELKNDKPTGKKVLYKPNNKGSDVYHTPGETKYPDQGRPSEANHGNVTPDIAEAGGVTVAAAEQTIVLSLPALRRLRFPLNDGAKREVDDAARTVLAALGLCAAALAAESGLDLRSRCLLWPDSDLTWTLLDRPQGGEYSLPADAAIALFKEAVESAKKVGLPWRDKPLRLKPSDELVKLVIKSQRLALQQAGDTSEA